MQLLRTAGIATLALALSATAFAQWPAHVPPNVPKGADGKPNLDAPPPRAADGKIDFSGVWEISRPPSPQPEAGAAGRGSAAGAAGRGGAAGRDGAAGAAGRGGAPPAGNVFGNIGAQIEGGAPYQPWAAELVKKRMADNSKDNPDAHCLPMGVMQMTSHPYPRKLIQAPNEIVLIYEGSGTTVREAFMDGRPLPDPSTVEPWWNGYSVARWEGNDTLVIETNGFMDDGWLDVRGSPLTNAGKLTERFRRPSFGRLELEVTIDDPKAYTRPFTARLYYRLSPETQLIEFVCIDKSAQHYVGAEAPSTGK
jgi:hypothetical protein